MPIIVGVAGGLLLAQAAAAVFLRLRDLLLIVLVSFFLSFGLEPAVRWLAVRGIRRGFGTGLVFVVAAALLAGFVTATAGIVIEQVRTLLSTAPFLAGDLAAQAEEVLPEQLAASVALWFEELQGELPRLLGGTAESVGRGVVGVGQTVLGGLFQIATIALVTFYLVADGPRFRYRLASRLPRNQQIRVLGAWELAIAKTGGYVYSRMLTAVVSAAFHIAAFSFIGVEYAAALGIWVGLVSSLLPAVGTYIAGALPLLVALAESPGQGLWVLVVIVVYQQIENYLVVPHITASTLELHPAIAFLSVLAGGVLAGVTGALLAIPAVAIVTALLSAATEEYDVLQHHLIAGGRSPGHDLVDRLEAERRARDTGRNPSPGADT